MPPAQTHEQEEALRQNHGFLVRGSYVLLSADAYRALMGVGDDDAYRNPLRAVQEGPADVEAGRTRPVGAFFREIDRKHETIE